MAFFVSPSLSVTTSDVDLPVALLQLPSQQYSQKLELTDSHLIAGESKHMNTFHSFFLITDRAPALHDLIASTKRLQPF